MGASNRKTAVELVESSELDLDELLAPAGDDDGAPPTPRASWRRVVRRGWPVALVAAVVVGLYAVTSVREASRTEARTEVLRAGGMYVGDVGPDLRAVWALDGVGLESVSGWADGLVFVSEEDGGLRTVDLESGEDRWRLEPEGDGLRYCWRATTAADGSTTVACERYTTGESDGQFSVEDRILELRDGSTGELIGSREADGHVSISWWGTELLVLDDVDGALELRLESPDGEVRWTLPVPGGAGGWTGAWVEPDVGLALVRTSHHLAVDRDGRVVLDRPVRAGAEDVTSGLRNEWVTTLPGGGFAVAHYGESEHSVEYFDADGELQLEAEGMLATPVADDGTVPGLAVTMPLWGLVAHDRATAETVLEVNGQPQGYSLLLHGMLLYERDGEMRAVDVASGEERWRTALLRSELLGTDGDVLLFLDTLSEPRLRAISVHTGQDAWSYPMPGAEAIPMVVDGALLLFDGGVLMRLGSDG